MTKFTVRIELHKTDDYEPLHKEMANRGFTRTIESNTGSVYHLPPGEYNEISTRTGPEVRAEAVAAIRAIKKKGAVLITPSGGRFWQGLDEIEYDEDD
ncbi:MAG: hypothetical protein WA840_03725 [Caulobacteraceae bacterium]